ncbi:MAG TPA: cell division protein ZapA [Treponema sp.]|nr:cell division protein ZapA [Treponema sp.]
MGKLQIDILGASFAVQAREDEAYLQKLLTYYKEITDTIQKTGIKNPVQTSIIAGITLVDELYKEKSKNASLSKSLEQTENINVQEADEAERLTLDMISAIDKALE